MICDLFESFIIIAVVACLSFVFLDQFLQLRTTSDGFHEWGPKSK